MSDNSSIEWTDDTWNPIRGCSRVSEGCRHCYAEDIAARFSGPGLPYEGLAKRVTTPTGSDARWTGTITRAPREVLLHPLKRKAPRKIFVNAMSDLFHEGVPDEWIDEIFAVMALCPQHTFQILTKRPERMRSYVQGLTTDAGRVRMSGTCDAIAEESEPGSSDDKHWANWFSQCKGDEPLPNVWIGVSVEDQVTADTRIPYLLQTPAAVRFISAEPLLGAIDLTLNLPGDLQWSALGGRGRQGGLDWVIVGGESGPKARPMHPAWAKSLRDQCAAAGVAFLFKQWGEWRHAPEFAHFKDLMLATKWQRISSHVEGVRPALMIREGKKRAGRKLDGIEHNAFPKVRHVRP